MTDIQSMRSTLHNPFQDNDKQRDYIIINDHV